MTINFQRSTELSRWTSRTKTTGKTLVLPTPSTSATACRASQWGPPTMEAPEARQLSSPKRNAKSKSSHSLLLLIYETHLLLQSPVCSVERDAQLLANRIALLKQEEVKTWKKIEETKKRAAEVFKLKQRNNEKVQAKMEKMQYDTMVAQQNRQRIDQMRKERNLEKVKIQQSILMSKHEEAR